MMAVYELLFPMFPSDIYMDVVISQKSVLVWYGFILWLTIALLTADENKNRITE